MGGSQSSGPYIWLDKASHIPERFYEYVAVKAADDDALTFVDDRHSPGPRGIDRKATAKRRAANRAARKARKPRP